MREIKFRAWNDTTMTKTFNIWDRVAFSTTQARSVPLFETQDIIMEFTGLLDKNGLEIYEGDIIEFTYTSGMTEIKSISYLDGMFIFDDKYRNSIRHNNTSCEVIGNIYENPELLVSTDNKGDRR